jgi:hypothetical protein
MPRVLIVAGLLTTLFPAFARAEQQQVSAAEAATLNCTLRAIRLEDQLNAANEKIAQLQKGLPDKAAPPPAAPEPAKK